MLCHVLMMLFENYPKHLLIYSLFCQLIYSQLLNKFPMLEPNTSIPIISSGTELEINKTICNIYT